MTATVTFRDRERASIETFLTRHLYELGGTVLDFGCGRRPYRRLLRGDGEREYVGFDRAGFPASVSGCDFGPDEHDWPDVDSIVCTQVIQYLDDPAETCGGFRDLLAGGQPGVLLLTGPLHWPVVETEDRWRFTPSGVLQLLVDICGFRSADVEPRLPFETDAGRLYAGWQAVAYA